MTAGEALRIFRARSDRPLELRPGEPAPGVYRYSTRGSESVETALGIISTTHDFRGTSTLSVIPTRCGIVERWQVLATRWAEVASCRDSGGYRLLSVDEMHEFFGVDREVLYRCREPVRPGPAQLRPGIRWRGRCGTGDSGRLSSFRVLGFEPVRVAGRRFPAVRTWTKLKLTGTYSGSASQEDWRRRTDGLLLRRISRTDGFLGGAISADYAEHYEIELRSPHPQR